MSGVNPQLIMLGTVLVRPPYVHTFLVNDLAFCFIILSLAVDDKLVSTLASEGALPSYIGGITMDPKPYEVLCR